MQSFDPCIYKNLPVNKRLYVLFFIGFTEQNYIVSVITDMMKITRNCVTFIPRTTEKDFVYIQNAGEYVII